MITYTTDKLQKVLLSGGCEQRNLPSGYTQVEYLSTENESGPYIDTGYIVGSNTRIKATYKLSSINFIFPISVRDSNTAGAGFGFGCDGTYFISDFGGNRATSTIIPNTTDVIFLDKNRNVTTIKIGTQTETLTNTTVSFTTRRTLVFFAQRSVDIITTGKYVFYSFKLYEDDVLLRNLIPARRLSDNVLGMYDTVTGNFFTNRGTGTFTAGPDVVPTPDAPMDIVCNNGAIKVRHQSGLPLGYTKIEYIDTDGNSWIDTGIVPTATTLQVDYKMQILQQEYVSLFGAVANTTPKNGFRVFYQPTMSTNVVNWQSYSLSGTQGVVWNKALEGTVKVETQTNKIISTINGQTQTFFSTNSVNLTLNETILIGTSHLGTSTSGMSPSRIWYLKISKEDVVVFNGIPCRRNSDNVLGMYDLVSGNFLTNQSTGTFIAGTDVNDLEIYADGTQEQVTDNLGNTATAEMLLKVGDYIDTQSVLDGNVTRNLDILVLKGDETNLEYYGQYQQNNLFYIDIATEQQFIYPSVAPLSTHYNFYIGSPYNMPNECIRYQIRLNSYNQLLNNINRIYIADNRFNDLVSYRGWLTEQYSNGTPIIIVKHLVKPTREHVTPQFLAGNSVTLTAGSIDNLTIKLDVCTELKWRYIDNKEVKKVYIGENLVFDPYNGHEYIDLGLPSGTKWATMNVGASSETDYGNGYKYGKGAATYQETYQETNEDTSYEGTEDPLDFSVDTAAQVWGGSWHMPTRAQVEELRHNTRYNWVTNYKDSGIDGGTFTATNGAVLFFPAAGLWLSGVNFLVGSYGYCWTSSPVSSSSSAVYRLMFSSGGCEANIYNRTYGFSVRPVVG